jgi:hypothetical protein
MRKKTLEYIDYVEDNMKVEFIIICVSDCVSISSSNFRDKFTELSVKVGQKFKINNHEYNYVGESVDGYLRLPNLGLFPKKNFKKLSDFRENKIDDLLNYT